MERLHFNNVNCHKEKTGYLPVTLGRELVYLRVRFISRDDLPRMANRSLTARMAGSNWSRTDYIQIYELLVTLILGQPLLVSTLFFLYDGII